MLNSVQHSWRIFIHIIKTQAGTWAVWQPRKAQWVQEPRLHLGQRIISEKLVGDLVMYKLNWSDRFLQLVMILVWKHHVRCQTVSARRPPALERPLHEAVPLFTLRPFLHTEQFRFQRQDWGPWFSNSSTTLTSETFAFLTHQAFAESPVEFGQKTHHTLFDCSCLTSFYLQIISTVGPPSISLTKALASPEQMDT